MGYKVRERVILNRKRGIFDENGRRVYIPEKQKRAFVEMLKNPDLPKRIALKRAGYSDSMAMTAAPTRTKSWAYLMEKYLPDRNLARVHKQLLNKKEIHIIRKDENGKEIYEELKTPDTQAATKALEMAYKLKRRYGDDITQGVAIQVVVPDAVATRFELKRTANRIDNRSEDQDVTELSRIGHE